MERSWSKSPHACSGRQSSGNPSPRRAPRGGQEVKRRLACGLQRAFRDDVDHRQTCTPTTWRRKPRKATFTCEPWIASRPMLTIASSRAGKPMGAASSDSRPGFNAGNGLAPTPFLVELITAQGTLRSKDLRRQHQVGWRAPPNTAPSRPCLAQSAAGTKAPKALKN